MSDKSESAAGKAVDAVKRVIPWGWVGLVVVAGFAFELLTGSISRGAKNLFNAKIEIGYFQGLIFLSALGVALLVWIVSGIKKGGGDH